MIYNESLTFHPESEDQNQKANVPENEQDDQKKDEITELPIKTAKSDPEKEQKESSEKDIINTDPKKSETQINTVTTPPAKEEAANDAPEADKGATPCHESPTNTLHNNT